VSASDIAAIASVIGPSCRDNTRRQILLKANLLNGIDYIEFESPAPNLYLLHVHFLLPLPADGFGLITDPSAIAIHGGTRITDIAVQAATLGVPGNVLDVAVSAQGDFSPYLLSIGWSRKDGAWQYDSTLGARLDRSFAVAPVNFRAGCPADFDCATPTDCAHDDGPEPELDYLARDYASFRQLLLDLIAARNPGWIERSPADLGIALLELLAHEGDHLTYMQDAVAAEMYLDTARRRESAKRHAHLIDYQMHDGANAATHVHVQVAKPVHIPPKTQLLTGIDVPMRLQRHGATTQPATAPPGAVIDAITAEDYDTDPALSGVRVFETLTALDAEPTLNELRIHTWGNERCCLPRGQTTLHLYAVDTAKPAAPKAVAPDKLKAGDLLLIEEQLGPETGSQADADPTHRQVVTIIKVQILTDPVFLAALDADGGLVATSTGTQNDDKLPLVEVTWRPEDALTFPLCLAATPNNGTVLLAVSLARANIVAADHGRTIAEVREFAPSIGGERQRITLGHAPLTIVPSSRSAPAGDTNSSVTLQITHASGATDDWSQVPSLLTSRDTGRHFVVDVDHRGRGILRFGDGEYGRVLVDATRFDLTYRIGNGPAGNIGAQSIRHVVISDDPTDPKVLGVYNPLPATGGLEPESIEEVRQLAPAAFRTQRRAVTAEDYRDLANTIPGVAGAVAAFMWTGSWYTALVGIDPADPADLDPDQPGRLAPTLRQRVIDALNGYRLAGYDLEVRGATYVPIDIQLTVCVKPGYFRGDVARAVALVLAGAQPGTAGLFNPARFTFGQPVYLSRVYAAAESVPGVESVHATAFQRHGRLPAGELDDGVITVGGWEIAQLDNDPNRVENGVLTVTAGGGS
jgi:hypothetical protein